MRIICDAQDSHHAGLQQAARSLRGQVSQRTLRRLRGIDSAFAVTRHITKASITQFLDELRNELQVAGYTLATPTGSTTMDAGGDGAATLCSTYVDSCGDGVDHVDTTSGDDHIDTIDEFLRGSHCEKLGSTDAQTHGVMSLIAFFEGDAVSPTGGVIATVRRYCCIRAHMLEQARAPWAYRRWWSDGSRKSRYRAGPRKHLEPACSLRKRLGGGTSEVACLTQVSMGTHVMREVMEADGGFTGGCFNDGVGTDGAGTEENIDSIEQSGLQRGSVQSGLVQSDLLQS